MPVYWSINGERPGFAPGLPLRGAPASPRAWPRAEFRDALPYAAAVALLEQWREIQARLPERWATTRLSLVIEDEADCDRAAFLLGPVNPGRRGKQVRFRAARGGLGPSANLVGRLLCLGVA